MKYKINKGGDLEISVSRAEQSVIKAEKNLREFLSNDYLYDLFEKLVNNSDLDWIFPEEIGALTDAPILGNRDDDGEPTSVWWYPQYQVRSPQEDLAEDGQVIFQKAQAEQSAFIANLA